MKPEGYSWPGPSESLTIYGMLLRFVWLSIWSCWLPREQRACLVIGGQQGWVGQAPVGLATPEPVQCIL